jgi:hypothetical protein
VNEGQAPRQNRDGHPCPPWCEVDHVEPVRGIVLGHHGTKAPLIEAGTGYVHASAYHHGFSGAMPQVALSGLDTSGAALVSAEHAEILAVIIGQLADATPDQHRELAAAIRQAAAQIADAEVQR